MARRASAEDLNLARNRYGFGVSWNALGGRNVDIDLQCVVVDFSGAIIDCAYYNNLKAVRAITHSGDEAVGKPDNIEEMVWVNLQKLPPNVAMLIFVVAAYSGGSLKDVANGRLHIMEERESCEVGVLDLERTSASVNIAAAMLRNPLDGSGPRNSWRWNMRILSEIVQEGQHFMDVLPQLSGVIRRFLPHAPQRQKVAFAMEKEACLTYLRALGRSLLASVGTLMRVKLT
jgi:tellurium resistance protein TerZ